MKSTFLKEMHERGYINQCTDLEKLDKIISTKSISAYIGFDCTASSLHVGSLLQIMILRLLQKHLFSGENTPNPQKSSKAFKECIL